MKKKTIAIIAVMLVLALILCSCGSNNNTSNGSSNKGFSYSASFTEDGYWKDIKASEYVTLPVIENIEIKQSDIEEQIDDLLEDNPYSISVTDRAVKDGDSVNIDYVGAVNGETFEGGSTEGQGTDVTIGVTNYIDGFLDQLIGHKPGETFNINVTFPDPYENNTALSGADAIFTITINYITEKQKGEWGDKFVEDKLYNSYGWKTTAEAEEDIIEYLVEDYLFDNSTFEKDVPETMMKFQKESAVAYYQKYADAYNMSLEDFMTYYLGIDSVDALWEAIKSESEEYSKNYLIYQAVAEKLDYKVSDDDLKAYFLEHNGSEDYSSIEESYGLPYIKYIVTCEKVIKKLSADAKIIVD